VCDSLSPSLTLSRSPSAVRDGWTAEDFHRLCDGKGATLTLVRSEAGYVFGGYTSEPWMSPSRGGTCVRVCVSVCTHVCVSSVYKPDAHAFLFSLTNAAGVPPAKAKATHTIGYVPAGGRYFDKAMIHNKDFLPFFGECDLIIGDDAHLGANSSTRWGSTYPLARGAADNTFLVGGGDMRNGSAFFKVAALEVFLVQPKAPVAPKAPKLPTPAVAVRDGDMLRASRIDIGEGSCVGRYPFCE
jgi:hypothetical protein